MSTDPATNLLGRTRRSRYDEWGASARPVARTDAQPANTPGYQYLCFEVTDVAVAAARARDAGATQSDDMAAMSGRNQYHCTDPDGNRLVLMALDATDSDLSINALSDPGITARLLALREASRSSKFSKQKASSL